MDLEDDVSKLLGELWNWFSDSRSFGNIGTQSKLMRVKQTLLYAILLVNMLVMEQQWHCGYAVGTSALTSKVCMQRHYTREAESFPVGFYSERE